MLHLLPIHWPFVHMLGVKNHLYSAVLLLEDALGAFFFCTSQDAQREMTRESVRSRERTRTESTHARGLEIKMCLIAGVRGQSVFAGRSSPLQADKQVIC